MLKEQSFQVAQSEEKPEIELTIEQDKARQEFMFFLSKGSVDAALKIKDAFNLPEQITYSSRIIQLKAHQGFIECFQRGRIKDAARIMDMFSLPADAIEGLVKQEFEVALRNRYIYTKSPARRIIEEFDLSEEVVQEAAKEEVSRSLSLGDFDHAVKVIKEFKLSEESLATIEVKPDFKNKFTYSLSTGGIRQEREQDLWDNGDIITILDTENLLTLKEKLNLPQEFIGSPKVQEAAKDGFVRLLSDGYIYYAFEIIDKFNLPEEIINSSEVKESIGQAFVHRLFNDNVHDALKIKDRFNLSEAVVQAGAKKSLSHLISEGKIKTAIEVNNEFHLGEEKVLQRVYDDFGDAANFEIYEIYRDLLIGRIPKSLPGIKQAGEAGINQFKQTLRGLQKDLLQDEADKEMLESSAIQPWLMNIVGYESSEWGEHNQGAFRDTVDRYLHLKAKRFIRPLSPEYKESEVLKIPKIDKEKQEEFKHIPAFLSRYDTILSSLQEARALSDQPDGIIQLFDRLSKTRDEQLIHLDEQTIKLQSSKMPEDRRAKALENIKKQKELLDSLDLKHIKSGQGPQEIFRVLSSFKSFNDDLRTLVFYASFSMNPQYKTAELSGASKQKPTLGELSWVMNFTDHITNQETLSKYFSDEESLKRFNSLLNISALEQEMARMQNQKKGGEMPFQFVPTRNLLTEFSGHIADACWASKYDSILEEFPNFVSLIMVQNPEKEKDAHLAGAAMLIETESRRGEPLLVIRGLNPKENVINQLSVEDFYNELVNYLKPIAEKQGRKLAIVIDDHSGGAGTNRPVLFSFLSGLQGKLKRISLRLGSSEDDEIYVFNGYDISDDVYLVE